MYGTIIALDKRFEGSLLRARYPTDLVVCPCNWCIVSLSQVRFYRDPRAVYPAMFENDVLVFAARNVCTCLRPSERASEAREREYSNSVSRRFRSRDVYCIWPECFASCPWSTSVLVRSLPFRFRSLHTDTSCKAQQSPGYATRLDNLYCIAAVLLVPVRHHAWAER